MERAQQSESHRIKGTEPVPERFQILSLDGGGIKGLFSAAVLAAIEEDLGISVINHFDLITGTSTGGIIALGLGLGLSPRKIVEFYVSKGPGIFRNRFKIGSIRHWVFQKFPQAPLRDALKEIFEDKRLADSKKRLVIPAYNLGEDDVYLFKTPHHERLRRDYKEFMWKTALATSAAPTYFPPCRNINAIRLIDGGVWANNPTMVGIIEAVSLLGVNLKAVSVLSLGTSDPVILRPKRLDWSGKLLWASSAVDVIMRGQSLGVTKQAQHLLGEDKVERLDPKVPDGLFALDNASVEELLAKAAHESRGFAPHFEKKFKPHIAAPYTPHYT